MLRVLLVLALAVAGCNRSGGKGSPRPPATPAEVPDGAVGAGQTKAGRALFVDAPELVDVLELGLVTQLDESWVLLPQRGKVNHCFAAYLEIDDVQKTGARFDELVRGLGHEAVVTNAAITVEKDGLLIALMLTGVGRAIVNACWAKKRSAAKAFADLLPSTPPLSEAREIAARAGGLQHVTLEWSEERGVSVRLAGAIPEGKAAATAAWFTAAGYGDIEPDGDLVEQTHEDGIVTLTAVHDDNWIVELNDADGESPFAH